MLAQWHNGKLHPVKFFSHSFTAVEGCWPTTHQELFAVKHLLEHFRPYLLGRKLTVITDHGNLQWLTSISPSSTNLHAGVFLWQSMILKLNIVLALPDVVPDVLSRAPLTHSSTTGDDLFIPPQPVTCFLTSLIGFDIPYLDPSYVSEIF